MLVGRLLVVGVGKIRMGLGFSQLLLPLGLLPSAGACRRPEEGRGRGSGRGSTQFKGTAGPRAVDGGREEPMGLCCAVRCGSTGVSWTWLEDSKEATARLGGWDGMGSRP